MALNFNADEIFEMAEQIERNGAAFYRKAAENVMGEEKDFLLELAGMEDDHLATFTGLRGQLTARQKEPITFDPDELALQYLKALADTRVFFEKDMDPSGMNEILKAAIIAEKDSILFYVGMKEFVPEKLGKGRIDDIIKEEMSHIRLLGARLVKGK